jgi:hypothetical protein
MFAQVAKKSARQVQSRLHHVAQVQSCYNGSLFSKPLSAFAAQNMNFTVGIRHLNTSFDLPDPAAPHTSENKPFQLTKIVATIGPTSEQLEPMRKVVNAGMKIMRLNFSHATVEEVELRIKNLALCQVSTYLYASGKSVMQCRFLSAYSMFVLFQNFRIQSPTRELLQKIRMFGPLFWILGDLRSDRESSKMIIRVMKPSPSSRVTLSLFVPTKNMSKKDLLKPICSSTIPNCTSLCHLV